MQRTIHRIVTVTPNYPHHSSPERGAFVEALVKEWKRNGVMNDVIAPLNIVHLIKGINQNRYTIKPEADSIHRPIYSTFTCKKVFGLDFKKVSRYSFINAALQASRKIEPPDLYYGKFLLRGGAAAALIGEKYQKPSFADLGESRLYENLCNSELRYAQKIISKLTGIICVSERLKAEAIKMGADPVRILLAPNSIDQKRFRPLDKMFCRQKLDLPKDAFIISFTGNFIERKGPLRVLEAIKTLPKNVYGIFLGKGKQVPIGDRVLKADSVPNEELPYWLNATDLFVLPTLAEGHCNAINEAIACGIPVISSDIPDIRKQIPEQVGLLINPRSITSISTAIDSLYNNTTHLDSLKKGCLTYTEEKFQSKRGKIIVEWLTEMLSELKC